MSRAELDPDRLARFVAGDVDDADAASADADALRAYRRLTDALPAVGADLRPPAGWESRVLAAVAGTPPRVPWWRRGFSLIAAPAVAVAVAAALLVWLRTPHPRPPTALALAVEIQTDQAVRSASAAVGDTLVARGSGGAPHQAIWIFRDGRRLTVCPGPDGCDRDRGALRATVKISAPGRYQIIYLAADAPLPQPGGLLEADLAAATAIPGGKQRMEVIEVW